MGRVRIVARRVPVQEPCPTGIALEAMGFIAYVDLDRCHFADRG